VSHSDPASTAPPILIIDDSPIVTRALSQILQQEGYNTEVFHTGADTLDYAQKQLPIAAAIVDIHLPDISGLVLSYKLRESYGPDRPIIVLSGDTSIENIKTLPHIGATYFISKPFNPDLLIERLKTLIPTAAR